MFVVGRAPHMYSSNCSVVVVRQRKHHHLFVCDCCIEVARRIVRRCRPPTTATSVRTLLDDDNITSALRDASNPLHSVASAIDYTARKLDEPSISRLTRVVFVADCIEARKSVALNQTMIDVASSLFAVGPSRYVKIRSILTPILALPGSRNLRTVVRRRTTSNHIGIHFVFCDCFDFISFACLASQSRSYTRSRRLCERIVRLTFLSTCFETFAN